MAIDPKANAEYVAREAKPFAVGQSVWVTGIEFKVVAVTDGQLVLQPTTAKI
jgi:hypothetical protein